MCGIIDIVICAKLKQSSDIFSICFKIVVTRGWTKMVSCMLILFMSSHFFKINLLTLLWTGLRFMWQIFSLFSAKVNSESLFWCPHVNELKLICIFVDEFERLFHSIWKLTSSNVDSFQVWCYYQISEVNIIRHMV